MNIFLSILISLAIIAFLMTLTVWILPKIRKARQLKEADLYKYTKLSLVYEFGDYYIKIHAGRKSAFLAAFKHKGDDISGITLTSLSSEDRKLKYHTEEHAKQDMELLDAYLQTCKPNGVVFEKRREQRKQLKEPSKEIRELFELRDAAKAAGDDKEVARIERTLQSSVYNS